MVVQPLFRREAMVTVAPAAAALVALAAAFVWLPRSPLGGWRSASLALIGALAALYTPLGRGTLGLGAMVLPVAAGSAGAATAGWLAGVCFALGSVLKRLLLRDPLQPPAASTWVLTLGDAGRLSLAALAATALWSLAPKPSAPPLPWPAPPALLGTVVPTYLGVLIGLRLVELRRRSRPPLRTLLAPAAVDLGGWFFGLVATTATLSLGWGSGLVVLVGGALLSAEAARNKHLRRLAARRAGQLWELSRAGQRILSRRPDLEAVAEQIARECRRVLPFRWFELELAADLGGEQTWHAGPDGRVGRGAVTPPAHPPPLPGFHRRATWRVLDQQLAADGQHLARLRFWCDPRQIEATAIELLQGLMPQLAASVHHTLLDRRVNRDPLTGLPDRRLLETRLEAAFITTRDEGSPLSVIMCDLDHFKRINDRFGHDAGDRALVALAEILQRHGRGRDLCCRYGGEEFSVVVEDADGHTALGVAERLRQAVEATEIGTAGSLLRLSMSCGVASTSEVVSRSARDLLVLADEALYEAKHKGRNRALLYLGRGRFRTPEGRVLGSARDDPEPSAPTIFS